MLMGGGTQLIISNETNKPYIEIIDNKIVSNDGIEEWDVSNDIPNTDPGFLGEVYAWGAQYLGQCGFGYASSNQLTPIKLYSTKWKKLAGYEYTLGIDEHSDLWRWGNSNVIPIKLAPTTKWKNISCSSVTSFAQDRDGYWYGWGWNNKGQLGIGTNTPTRQSLPVKLPHDTRWKNIFCNPSGTFAITDDGELYSWGESKSPEMGYTKELPYKVSNYICKKIVTVNDDTYYLLSEHGELWGWGWGTDGQFGFTLNGTKELRSPEVLFHGTKWKDVQTNNFAHYAQAEDGQWYQWGYNRDYSLGTGNINEYTQNTPTKCNYTDIRCDMGGTFAQAADGYWYVWGQNGYGNLGIGHSQHVKYPSRQGSTKWKTLFNGYNHTFGMI